MSAANLPSSPPGSSGSPGSQGPGADDLESRSPVELVDVLEIYYARELRRRIANHVRRLDDESTGVIAVDPLRKREARSYYDAMLFTADELLRMLGDEPPGLYG